MIRIFLILSLLLASLTGDGQTLKGRFNWSFNSLFDQLNLQSDNASNFTLAGSSVTQWTDISPSLRHASQATAGNKPTFNISSGVLFDGSNDWLTLGSEINQNVFSMYVVFMTPTPNQHTRSQVLIAGTSRNDFLLLTSPYSYILATAANGSISGFVGGEGVYQVLSIRVNGTSSVTKIDDRTPKLPASSLSAPGYVFGQIGRFNSGSFYGGYIKAIMISSQYLDDTNDDMVRRTLAQRYGLFNQAGKISFLGDSNTTGDNMGGTLSYTQRWAYQVATALGLSDVNLGINATALQSGTNSGISRYSTQLVTRPYDDKVVILYTNNTEITATYLTALETVVVDLISKGYKPRNICLSTPPYRMNNAQGSLLDATSAGIQTIATTYNTGFADVINALRNGGGNSLMFDVNHVNQSGAILVGQTILNQCYSGN